MIVDNVNLLPKEALDRLGRVVVSCGHELLGHPEEAPLHSRMDSSVTKTNIAYPTDVRLLWDSTRCMLKEMAFLGATYGVGNWRKHPYWAREAKTLFNRVRDGRKKKRSKEEVASYLSLCRKLLQRGEASSMELTGMGIAHDQARSYLVDVDRQIDQVDRRLLKGEKILPHEKVFSIFVRGTRMVIKGKAGCKAEFGLPVCIMEDQHQFILHHEILYTGEDSTMVVPFMREAMKHDPSIRSCSMDKGYSSRANLEELQKDLSLVVMPLRGRLTEADRARETSEEFRARRQQHPAIESAINTTNHRGLSRIHTRDMDRFEQRVSLSILAANLHRIGRILRERAVKRRRWYASHGLAA